MLLTVGGALGTNARYWLGLWIAGRGWFLHFPLGTLVINVSGSLLLGLVAVAYHDRLPSAYLFWGVGFCGGYTTFSTFSLELFGLLRTGETRLAFLYATLSVAAGLIATALVILSLEQAWPNS